MESSRDRPPAPTPIFFLFVIFAGAAADARYCPLFVPGTQHSRRKDFRLCARVCESAHLARVEDRESFGIRLPTFLLI